MSLPTQLTCKIRNGEWKVLYLRADECEQHYIFATARALDNADGDPLVKLLIPKTAMVNDDVTKT